MKHLIFFLFFFLFSYAAEDTTILLHFIKPSGASAHDIPLHADNSTILKAMSGTIRDVLEDMMKTDEPVVIPIALTEHADDYFYKLLLPLTKRLYLVREKLVPQTHLKEIQDTINKLSIQRQISLLRLSLFFDIPALDDLLVQGIANSLIQEMALEQFITNKNYLKKLDIRAEKIDDIAHVIALHIRPTLTKHLSLQKEVLNNPHATELIKILWNNAGTSLTAGYLLFNELIRWNISDNKTHSSIAVQENTNFIDFNKNSTQVAIGAIYDNKVILYDLTTNSVIRTIQNPSSITALSWSSRDVLALAGEDNIICLWNTTTGEKIKKIASHSASITSLAWSPDGSRLASGSEDKTVRLWSHNGQKIIQKHQTMVNKVIWSSDNANVFGCSKEIYAWNIHKEKDIFSYTAETAAFGSMSLNPTNTLLTTINEKNEIYIIDIQSRQLLMSLKEDDILFDIAWSPNAKKPMLAYVKDKDIILLNAQPLYDVIAILKTISLEQALVACVYPMATTTQRATGWIQSVYAKLPDILKPLVK